MSLSSALLAIPLLVAQLGETPNEMVSRAGRVGIKVDRRGDVLVVQSVDPGSSAETAGLKVGDQVLRIDLDNAERLSTSDASAALRGVLGSRTTLTVLPRASMLPKRVDVLRDVRVYLSNETTKMDPAELSAAFRGAPEAGSRTLEASFVSASQESEPAAAPIAEALGRTGPDVATCVGALRDVLPEGFPEEFAASFTVKRDAILVRTEPPSGDLASCLGKKAATWSLPKPGRKDAPVQFRGVWRWKEAGSAAAEPVPQATIAPEPAPEP